MIKDGYKNAFRATSLFGGVQFISIITNIFKSKLIALWLGPSGFGLYGIFNSVLTLISSISNFGLSTSAVRDIANAHGKDNIQHLSEIVHAIQRTVLISSFIGAIIMTSISYKLSFWTFNNDKYTFAFIFLSIAVLFTGIYKGHYALLQGTRRLKQLATANILGAIISFLITIPLYYFMKKDGIVISFVTSALAITIISTFFKQKIPLVKIEQKIRESIRIVKPTIILGIMMAISNIASYLVEFLVKLFITHNGGINDVGYYQAGSSLNGSYLGMIFVAMATDYYPRLSMAAENNFKLKVQVNQQAEIALLILGPMIILMLIFLSYVLNILYSSEFVIITSMVKWLLVGSLLRSGAWAISFIFLAKGDGKLFLFNELLINAFMLPIYMCGYRLFGLDGLGYAFLISYTLYLIWVIMVAWRKYRISYQITFWKQLFTLLIFSVSYIFLSNYFGKTLIIINIAYVICIVLYSYFGLQKRVDINSIILGYLKR